MNGAPGTVSTGLTAMNQGATTQVKSKEERKGTSNSETDNVGDKRSISGPVPKFNRYNPLPTLDKKGGSKARVITPPPSTPKEYSEENLTTQLSVHSRATNKIPLLGAIINHKSQSNSKQPNKSLPRLIGGNRKLEKIPKSKMIDPYIDPKIEKSKGFLKGGDMHENQDKFIKSNVYLKCFSKTIPGFSEGKTKTNQDTIYVNGNIKGAKNCSLFAAFDGHGALGHKVSQYLKSCLTGRFYLFRIFRNKV